MNFSFDWKFKDFEIKTTDNAHPYIELIKWEANEEGRRYCFTLAYFHRDKDGGYELHFVCDRPLEYIAAVDVGEIWKQLWLAQQMFEDAESKLEDRDE